MRLSTFQIPRGHRGTPAPVEEQARRGGRAGQGAQRPLLHIRRARRARAAALDIAAKALGVAPATVERALFADLPGEKLVSAPDAIPSPDEIVLRTNQLIARSLLFHARRVRVKAEGATRALVRQAKLRGLICNVTDGAPPVLELSGPFTVFRHTLLYGRALGELVQFLPHCARSKLRAECVLREREATLDLQKRRSHFSVHGAAALRQQVGGALHETDQKGRAQIGIWYASPSPWSREGPSFFPTSRCATACARNARSWSRSWASGRRTMSRVRLTLLRQAGIDNLILCVDEARICGEGNLPVGARIVRFRRSH